MISQCRPKWKFYNCVTYANSIKKRVSIFICSKTGNRQIQFITHFSSLDHLHSTATIFIISGYCLYYDYLTAFFESTYLFHLNNLFYKKILYQHTCKTIACHKNIFQHRSQVFKHIVLQNVFWQVKYRLFSTKLRRKQVSYTGAILLCFGYGSTISQ